MFTFGGMNGSAYNHNSFRLWFVWSSNSWFHRGGGISIGLEANCFDFSEYHGNSYSRNSFRLLTIIKKSNRNRKILNVLLFIDASWFVSYGGPWFGRGVGHSYGSGSGVFVFGGALGHANSNDSFRSGLSLMIIHGLIWAMVFIVEWV